MNEEKPQPVRYPLLESLLAQMNLQLRGTYTNRHVAEIFGVSVRTIQDWVRRGQLGARNLPGRGKFLSEDLESLLKNSVRRQTGERGAECE
jgi:transposase